MKVIFKTLLGLTFCFLVNWHAHSQQANNWYFGEKAGLTFNTNPPTFLADGILNTQEGCSSISDSTGQLLFYTDGRTVYNSIHQVMVNGTGLMGNGSSANSGYIVPQPGNPDKYFIFTADAYENNGSNGYRYSIVDMSLDGGLGAVTSKNILLYSPGTERLTAIDHSNGIDIWIVTKEWGNDVYVCYKLTCSGLDPIPVLSSAGYPLDGSYGDAESIGELKTNIPGNKLATTRESRGAWEIFDFDKTTGIISNGIHIPTLNYGVIGIEFSPNSNLIYVSQRNSVHPSGYIFQYKVDVHDSATIANSFYLLDLSLWRKGELQLGPDGKIYNTNEGDTTLNVIHNPNIYGAGCNFSYRTIELRWYHWGQRRLPSFYQKMIIDSTSDFTFTIQADCRTVTFNANSTLPSPLSWSWDFGDGTTGTGQNITHIFPTTGNLFNVSLTVTNTAGCGPTSTKQKFISFNRVFPSANFGATVQCGNLTVPFSDSSTIASGNSIIAWQWDFGDGQTSTQQNPTHNYTALGQYNVSLIVTANDGCQSKDTIIQTIYIEPQPNALFSFDQGCLNTPIQFTDQSLINPGIITQWIWSFGDGNSSSLQNPQHTYTSNGNQTVSLVAISSSGCSDTSVINLTITPKPVADFNFIPGCSNVPVTFTDNSTISSGNITSWFWDFGNGNTATSQNASETYNLPGSFTIKHVAISEGNCPSDTATQIVSIESKPIADFNAAITCGNLLVQFNDNSSPTGSNIISWAWDFGDGNTSNQQNPQHTYSGYGNYTVKLTAATQNGCQADTLIRSIIVAAKPVPDFTLPAVCLLDAYAAFSNTTTIADNSSVSYFWDFDDVNASPPGSDTSSAANPNYQYSAAALYNVKLIAISAQGCVDSVTKLFTVNGAVPRSDFRVLNPNNLCSNTDIQIKDSSTVNFGNITRLRIFWGDGDSTIDNAPMQAPNGKIYNHRYPYFGTPASQTYTITMYAYSGYVCVDVKTQSITLHASPQIQFNSLGEICQETSPVNFSQASEIWGLPGNGYYSGNGIVNPGTGTFDPAVADTGNHVITYTFITTQGCRADSSKTIRVNPTPKAFFTFNEACLPNASLQFSSQSSDPYYSTNQLQHAWNFNDPDATPGNPNSSSSVNPSHVFTTLNNYNVNLQVTSPKGCVKDTTIQVIADLHIFPQPLADFKLDSSKLFCQGTATTFINTSDSIGRNLTKWWWDFGDGNMDSLQRKPSHMYANAGAYTATLQVENEKGCRSEIVSKSVNIESIPNADFIFDTTCLGKQIQFTDLSTNAYGNILSWQWNFDDGNSSGIQNPAHTYLLYNNYSVSLVVSTGNGCSSVAARKNISINRVNIFAGNDTVAASGQSLQLLASGAQTYTWTPSIGLNNPNISNPVATLQNDQSYIVQGLTAAGCIGYDTIHIKVFKGADIFVPTGFTPNNDGRNDYLKPICVGIKELVYFSVYNRWGQLVFTTKDMQGRWDGRLKGIPQNTGTFVWLVKGVTYDGKVIEKKGTSTLIR